MAGTVPQEARDLLAFANTRAPAWADHAAELGLSPAQAADILAKVPELKDAIESANAARLAAVMATQQMNVVARMLFEAAAGAVRTIRAHVEGTQDESLYAIAGIEPPKVRSRQAQPPAAPTHLSATISGIGEVILAWKTRQPRGVSNVTFAVHRFFNNDPATARLIDIASGRRYVDTTVPQGIHSVHYRLVPRRGSQEGRSSTLFTLTLGSATTLSSAPTTAHADAPIRRSAA